MPKYEGLVLTTHRDGEWVSSTSQALRIILPGVPMTYSYGKVATRADPLEQTTLYFNNLLSFRETGERRQFCFWAPAGWDETDIIRHLIARYRDAEKDNL